MEMEGTGSAGAPTPSTTATGASTPVSRKILMVVGGSSPGLRGSMSPSPQSPAPSASSASPSPTSTTPSSNKRKRKITIKLPAMPSLGASPISGAGSTSPSSSSSSSSAASSTPLSFISLSSSLSSLPSSTSPSASSSASSALPTTPLRHSHAGATTTSSTPAAAAAPPSPSADMEISSPSTSTQTSTTSALLSPTVTSSPSLQSSPSLSAGPVKRVKGALVERPIIYGNISWWLGKKAEETRTHRWTTYVRGPHNEDLSYFIKKVVFTLHPSFPNPVRVIEKPPYEITEHGWGEFELGIRIHFVDPLEVPVDLVHALVLYPPEGSIGLSTKKPVIKEIYDEIEFHDPTEPFYKILKENEMVSVGSSPHPLAISRGRATESAQSEKERKDLDELAKARSKIREEIIKIRDAYERYDTQSRQLREEVKELTELAEEEYRKRQKLASALPPPSSSSSSSSSSTSEQ